MTRLHPAWLAFGGSLVLLVGLLLLLYGQAGPAPAPPAGPALVVYCAAGIRAPMEAIAAAYEKESGRRVEFRYGGSQTILTSLELSGQGDLFLPGDDSYLAPARQKGLLAEVLPLARMSAVLLARPDRAGDVGGWDGLLRDDVKLGQASPDAAAIGKLTRDRLRPGGRWEPLRQHTAVFKGTVNDVANAVRLGSLDAGIVWDAVAHDYPDLAVVRLPELAGASARVPLAVLRTSKRPTEALRFARYAAARDRGQVHFRQHGFAGAEKADAWAEVPELRLMGGAMLRPAVEETIRQFEARECVRVSRSYNGCGILVSEMRAGARPDVYFACDPQFMAQVHDLFPAPQTVSANQLVIAVPHGNPHALRTLRDLGRPGLKVGVGHERQCALGAITRETFEVGGVYAAVRDNVKVYSPTGDMLVNQLRAGSLDAVVVYRSNVAYCRDEVDAVPITGIPCAAPVQPVAVSDQTPYPQLAGRLVAAFQSPLSRRRFEELGFAWKWAVADEVAP
jgi:ABC-type molybdate transport system substrate-binding protein